MPQQDARSPYLEFDPQTQEFCAHCRSLIPRFALHNCPGSVSSHATFPSQQQTASESPAKASEIPTLRDRFAMAAPIPIGDEDASFEINTLRRYRWADAMLKARKSETMI